jgi:tryptophan-rich sensory protein
MLNILWTLLYFGYANITGAFIGVSLLWVSIVLMIYVAWEIDQKAAWMLVPYLAWVSFAVYLNYLSLG